MEKYLVISLSVFFVLCFITIISLLISTFLLNKHEKASDKLGAVAFVALVSAILLIVVTMVVGLFKTYSIYF